MHEPLVVGSGAAEDLERLTDFLPESAPESAADTTDLILDALETLCRRQRLADRCVTVCMN